MRLTKERLIGINLAIIIVFVGILIVLLIRPKELPKYYFEGEIKNFWVNNNLITTNTNGYIEKFNTLTLDKLVSSNKDKQSVYGFDNKSAVEIKINNKILVIGGINNNFTGTYVKVKNSDDVYLTKIILNKTALADLK